MISSVKSVILAAGGTDNTDRMRAGGHVSYLWDFSSTLPRPDHQVMLQWIHRRLRLIRLVVLGDLYLNKCSIFDGWIASVLWKRYSHKTSQVSNWNATDYELFPPFLNDFLIFQSRPCNDWCACCWFCLPIMFPTGELTASRNDWWRVTCLVDRTAWLKLF